MNQCPIGTFPYTIQQGDTLWRLAQRYNITVTALVATNPNINPTNLLVGQVICIPHGKGICGQFLQHDGLGGNIMEQFSPLLGKVQL